jgi:vancomycin resistance protein YoaR
MGSSKIISGITIDSVDVSGLDKTEACQLLEEKLKERQETTIKLKYQEYEKEVPLEQLEIESNIETIVDQALAIGRDNNIFINNFNIIKRKFNKENIDLEVNYNEEALEKIITDTSVEIPGIVQEYTYSIEDDELIVNKGKDGIAMETEKVKNQIIDEITDFSKDISEEITISVIDKKAESIDIEKIYNEIYTEPQDAYIIEDPFQVIVDKDGIDFAISMEEAKALFQEDKEEYIIPLKVTKASKTVSDLGSKAFPDQLSIFTTRYDAGNTDRTTNLSIACQKINGYVIQPGETFSYNQVLGKRTVENGYKEAAIYTNGGVENGIGGGICQISSTLYNAVVSANLDIVERHNHSFITSYVEAGKDATVSYGSLDFKFKNTRKYPVKIEAYIKSGVATVAVYGLKEDEEYKVTLVSSIIQNIPCDVEKIEDPTLPEGTEVTVTKGTNGCKSVTYRYVYNSAGTLISKTQVSADTYGTIKKTVKVGTKSTQTVNTSTQPTETSTETTSNSSTNTVQTTPTETVEPVPTVTTSTSPSSTPMETENTIIE